MRYFADFSSLTIRRGPEVSAEATHDSFYSREKRMHENYSWMFIRVGNYL